MVNATPAANSPTLEVTFDKVNKMYQPQETVTGCISLKFDKQMSFDNVTLLAESYMDTVSLIRGNLGRPALPKERRIYFMKKDQVVGEKGILFPDKPLKFSFKLESTTENDLIDGYVGVDFSILHKVTVVMKR